MWLSRRPLDGACSIAGKPETLRWRCDETRGACALERATIGQVVVVVAVRLAVNVCYWREGGRTCLSGITPL